MNNLLPFEPQLLPWTLLNESPTGVRCRYKGGGLGTLLGAALGLVAAATFTAAAQAASVSFSSTAPALGPDDISQLTTAANRTNNVDAGSDDNSVYLDNGRPIQGQTLRTGA